MAKVNIFRLLFEGHVTYSSLQFVPRGRIEALVDLQDPVASLDELLLIRTVHE